MLLPLKQLENLYNNMLAYATSCQSQDSPITAKLFEDLAVTVRAEIIERNGSDASEESSAAIYERNRLAESFIPMLLQKSTAYPSTSYMQNTLISEAFALADTFIKEGRK